MYSPEKIKQLLSQDIDDLVSNPELYAKDPARDFSRNRVLTAKDVILLPIVMESQSMKRELLKYYDYSENTPYYSAYYQQRKKLLPDTFSHLLYSFNSHFAPTLYKGKYVLTAVDGSGFNIFYNPKDPLTYIKPNGASPRGRNEIHVTAAYHIQDRVFTDAVIQPTTKKNEYAAICDLIDRCDTSEGIPLFIADRGFSSYNVFAHCFEKNIFFLIRAKDVFIQQLLRDDYPMDKDEFDITVTRIIIRAQSKSFRSKPNEPDLYRYIRSDGTFDFIAPREKAEYPLQLRLVRIKIKEGVYENLITNLPPDEFEPSDLCYLYNLRWNQETSFRELKHAVAAEDFHCRSFEYICHEVWARLILYNFCSRLTALVVINKTGKKHTHQVNYTMAIQNSHDFLRQKSREPPINILGLIGKYTEPIRPDRNFARNHRFQAPMKFTYRH